MSIDDTEVVDEIGVDGVSGKLVMTIADHLDWEDERAHILALQAKLNAYLRAIQSGDLVNSYPDAENRSVVIEVVGEVAIPESGQQFLARAASLAKELDVEIRARAGE
ncbi:MAG TPA: DUF6572 domain-containing protein [Polyangiaceae bacterium]|nr:DUF6572 domain-containing protein [Polyangiaceae bacterium]